MPSVAIRPIDAMQGSAQDKLPDKHERRTNRVTNALLKSIQLKNSISFQPNRGLQTLCCRIINKPLTA